MVLLNSIIDWLNSLNTYLESLNKMIEDYFEHLRDCLLEKVNLRIIFSRIGSIYTFLLALDTSISMRNWNNLKILDLIPLDPWVAL